MTLGADYDEIQEELGFHLGFGRDITAFSPDDAASITAWIKSGLRRFMFSPYNAKLENTYEWSFLKRAHDFGTQINQTEYDLPPDFGSPVSPLIWTSPTLCYRPVPFMNEAFVREKLSVTPTMTGIPTLCAVFQQRQDGSAEQRQGLVIYPIPDLSYPLRVYYDMLPDMLTETFPWPAGSSPHARTLLYACLAEATKRHDDNASYEADYQLALAASMNYDARQKGTNLGYCGDPNNRERMGYPYPWGNPWDEDGFTDLIVKVGGILYLLPLLVGLLS